MASSPKALHAACMKLMQQQKYSVVSQMLTKHLESRSDLTKPLILASSCCMNLGHYEQALDMAATCVTLDPLDAHGWYNATLSLSRMGKAAEAHAVLKQAPDRTKARAGFLRHKPSLKVESAFLSFQTREPSSFIWEALDVSNHPDVVKSLAWMEWRKKNFKTSLHWCKSLIRARADYIGQTLLMRCICNLECKENQKAATDAVAAMVLDPGDVSDLHLGIIVHLTLALQRMKQSQASKRAANFLEQRSPYMRQKDFESQSFLSKGNESKIKPMDEGGLHTPQGFIPVYEQDFGVVEGMLRAMPESQRRLLIDDRVPPFHEEFASGTPLPESNKNKCIRWLQKSYSESIVASKTLNLVRLTGENTYEKTEMLRRLAPDFAHAFEWWKRARIGDVQVRDANLVYPGSIYQTFSNIIPEEIPLKFGGTHVAVGYVDLGVLLCAKFSGDESAGALKFIGYEKSMYATGRTKVLVQMMKDGADVDSILQVGYSSGWNDTTLHAFKEAVASVLEEDQELDAVVRELLEHWRSAPAVSLLESQERWLNLHIQHQSLPANVLNREDRLEVIHYMLSGRLLDCSMGSIPMFSNPPEIPHMAREEYAFWLITPEEVGANYGAHGSIMAVVIDGLRKRIRKLRDLIQNRRVLVDLRLAAVTPGNDKVLQDIFYLQPSSMSWSNLSDHMILEYFHSMLQDCATDRTIHHMHSMNWIKDVKGVFLIDYPDLDTQTELTETCFKESAEYMQGCLGDSILRLPPVALPYNICNMLSSKFSQKWLEHFMAADGFNGIRMVDVALSRYTPLHMTPTMYMSFSYKGLISQAGDSD